MRIALVHDWLIGMRGGEKCLEEFVALFPDCEIFTLFHEPDALSKTLQRQKVTSSVLNRVPFLRRYHRHLLPFYPLGISDLSRHIARAHERRPFDLVVSVSHCAAKNIVPPRGVIHLCYCLTPVRYFWDQYERYFSRHPLEPIIRMIIAPLRAWDVRGARSVTRFVAISDFVRSRIQRYYGRDADVVYPPVRNDWLTPRRPGARGEGFLCVQALVPYKNTDVIIEAFNRLQLPLSIVGTGPERTRLERLAGPTITFLGRVDNPELAALYRDSKALIFAAEEDFGITPVEMQASGRPVIALGKGGALETVHAGDGPSGLFFQELTAEALANAVLGFLEREEEFSVQSSIEHAERFSLSRFQDGFFAVLQAIGLDAVDRVPEQYEPTRASR